MRTAWLILALICSAFVGELAADSAADFSAGVSQYKSGDFARALESFLAAEKGGLSGAELYYNLANCYFKIGRKGLAVANYLKAVRLAPRNSDIVSNLHYVRSTLRDKAEDSLQNPIWNFIRDSALYFKANELTWVASACYFALVIILIYLVLFRVGSTWWAAAALGLVALLALSGGLLAVNLKMNYANPQAVIVEPEVQVYSGPGEGEEVRFIVHEGLTFRILRQESGYYEGIFANRLKGWVDVSKAYQFF